MSDDKELTIVYDTQSRLWHRGILVVAPGREPLPQPPPLPDGAADELDKLHAALLTQGALLLTQGDLTRAALLLSAADKVRDCLPCDDEPEAST